MREEGLISLWHRLLPPISGVETCIYIQAPPTGGGAWVGLYVRELREVRGVEVQAPRQPLHQLRALVGGEGPGGGREKEGGVQMRMVQAFTRQNPVFQEGAGTVRNPQMGHCAQARAVFVLHVCTHTNARASGAVPGEKGSAASSGLVNHLLFFKPRDKQ